MKGKFLCVMEQYDRETEQKLNEIQNLLKYNGLSLLNSFITGNII